MYMSVCLSICMSATCISATKSDQKRALTPLKLGWQMIVSHHVGGCLDLSLVIEREASAQRWLSHVTLLERFYHFNRYDRAQRTHGTLQVVHIHLLNGYVLK